MNNMMYQQQSCLVYIKKCKKVFSDPQFFKTTLRYKR